MKFSIFILLLYLHVAVGFKLLDLILTKETMTKYRTKPRLRKDYLCWRSDYNLGTILKTFLSTSSRPIDNYKNISRDDFCYYCRYKKHFDTKYTHHYRKDKNVNVLNDISLIVNMLDRECKFEWDRGSRGHDIKTAPQWINEWLTNKIPVFKNNCSTALNKISVAHSYSGASKMAYMAAKASRIALDETLSIALAVIHETDILSRRVSCFDLINTFSYFKPDICTGQMGSLFQSSCPESCRIVEGRIVENTFNDCCNDCFGTRMKLKMKYNDKIDLIPHDKWSEVI
jgi:hypothetical protein